MRKRFCQRRWIRGAVEGGRADEGRGAGGEGGVVGYGHLGTKILKKVNETIWSRWLRERVSFFDFWAVL